MLFLFNLIFRLILAPIYICRFIVLLPFRLIGVSVSSSKRKSLQSTEQGLQFKGYRWSSALDERSCLECLERDGSVFKPDAVPKKHRDCRCCLLPITPTWEELGFSKKDFAGAPGLIIYG